jgi:GTP-binding nuclear protein Ran
LGSPEVQMDPQMIKAYEDELKKASESALPDEDDDL